MIIKATPEQVVSPGILSLVQKYVFMTGGHFFSEGRANYPFSPEGEMMFTRADLDTCVAQGVEVDNLTCFITLPDITSEVPVAFPDSAKGSGGQRTWGDYAPFHWKLPDGTYLVRCVHTKEGETSGDGISYSELLIWDNFMPVLVKAEGVKLIPQGDA